MSRPEEIIPDAEIIRVHGNANFGSTTPREVVNDGVRKYAVGYSGGHTQLRILLEHGLIRKPKPGKHGSSLTEKGKRYARSIWHTHFRRADMPPTLEQALALPEVQALVEAAEYALAVADYLIADLRHPPGDVYLMTSTSAKVRSLADVRATLAALKGGAA